MYYLCSESIGADQMCNYCTDDLRFCFRFVQKVVEKRYDLIDAFNSTSRYLDDLLNIYLVQKETQCFYLQFLGLKILISKIVLIQWFCLPIKTLIA